MGSRAGARRLFIIDAGDAVPVEETARRVCLALRPADEPRITEIGIRPGRAPTRRTALPHETTRRTNLPGVLEIVHDLRRPTPPRASSRMSMRWNGRSTACPTTCCAPPPSRLLAERTRSRYSVPEAANTASEDECYATLVAEVDRLLIPDRPARLDDRGDSSVDEHLRTVREREERVRRRRGALSSPQ